jgi:hypothetical protein
MALRRGELGELAASRCRGRGGQTALRRCAFVGFPALRCWEFGGSSVLRHRGFDVRGGCSGPALRRRARVFGRSAGLRRFGGGDAAVGAGGALRRARRFGGGFRSGALERELDEGARCFGSGPRSRALVGCWRVGIGASALKPAIRQPGVGFRKAVLRHRWTERETSYGRWTA